MLPMNTPDKDRLQPDSDEDSNDSVQLRVIVPVCVGAVVALMVVVGLAALGVALYKRYKIYTIHLSDSNLLLFYRNIARRNRTTI